MFTRVLGELSLAQFEVNDDLAFMMCQLDEKSVMGRVKIINLQNGQLLKDMEFEVEPFKLIENSMFVSFKNETQTLIYYDCTGNELKFKRKRKLKSDQKLRLTLDKSEIVSFYDEKNFKLHYFKI